MPVLFVMSKLHDQCSPTPPMQHIARVAHICTTKSKAHHRQSADSQIILPASTRVLKRWKKLACKFRVKRITTPAPVITFVSKATVELYTQTISCTNIE
jgi:hypothetical protein